jgi:outer membrane protein assembly factor BamA
MTNRYEGKTSNFKNLMKEGGIETTLTLPKFLVPFPAQRFTMKYNPRTVISTSYNYQDRPDYVRTIASTSLSYRWKGNSFNTHQLYPIDFNYVSLPNDIDSALQADIANTPLVSSFQNHTILASRYTFEYTTQVIEKKEDFIYLRSNIESAGNLLHNFAKLTPNENDTNLMGVPYFQYLKGDVEFQVHNQITQGNKVVYRFFAGMGYPLGNSDALPFEKLYFSGGPNGIRAWSTARLGPGSDTSRQASYASKMGDIRLEANLEYRFRLFWKLEGAFFLDVGNIWTLREYDTRPGTNFDWDRFYKEIAVGTGVGARFDFSFLIIRLDFGLKMRDPAILEGSRWIDFNSMEYTLRQRSTWQFGIGYPF